ncbi:hypothetical protein GOODEAATRI_025656 [Goodea atripinnis]|uniref:Uncharacterized protein n=1 Tax=Goodea atripinnis TaxID=208336 RepID=A0ABV0NN61_9TELE
MEGNLTLKLNASDSYDDLLRNPSSAETSPPVMRQVSCHNCLRSVIFDPRSQPRTVIPPAQRLPKVNPFPSSRPKTHSRKGERQSIHQQHQAPRLSPPNSINTPTP